MWQGKHRGKIIVVVYVAVDIVVYVAAVVVVVVDDNNECGKENIVETLLLLFMLLLPLLLLMIMNVKRKTWRNFCCCWRCKILSILFDKQSCANNYLRDAWETICLPTTPITYYYTDIIFDMFSIYISIIFSYTFLIRSLIIPENWVQCPMHIFTTQ